MNYDTLISLIGQFGYAALFLALWFGIIGLPFPDEVIVMTGGSVTSNGVLHMFPAFIVTYLGVISGLSLGYVLGRLLGAPVLDKLRRKRKMDKYLIFSEKLIQKYGSFSLCVGYFFPVIRHILPYLMGLNKMSFRRYALLSYTTGLVWTTIFFILGRSVGSHVEEIGHLVYRDGIWVLSALFVALVLYLIIRVAYTKRKKNMKSE
ncbi:DedA family protein [Paenibacillus sp. NPDC057934]|uniref:DedA family protein n=1 Tax=Paenibacillus sp. NPDC057934 TaxID=3346282 RepID=UPI0036DC7585